MRPIGLGLLEGGSLVAFRLDDVEVDLPALTPAEREVALLAMMGLSAAVIARARKCSNRTVANQLRAIYRKLGIRSKAELVLRTSRAFSGE